MPFVNCPLHRGNPAPRVCSHISERVLKRLSLSSAPIEVVLTLDDNVESGFPVTLCRECVESLNNAEVPIKFETVDADRAFRMADSVVCKLCLEEAVNGAT